MELFVYFPFSHQVESNSDPSRPLYPLDHHHSHDIGMILVKLKTHCTCLQTFSTTSKQLVTGTCWQLLTGVVEQVSTGTLEQLVAVTLLQISLGICSQYCLGFSLQVTTGTCWQVGSP